MKPKSNRIQPDLLESASRGGSRSPATGRPTCRPSRPTGYHRARVQQLRDSGRRSGTQRHGARLDLQRHTSNSAYVNRIDLLDRLPEAEGAVADSKVRRALEPRRVMPTNPLLGEPNRRRLDWSAGMATMRRTTPTPLSAWRRRPNPMPKLFTPRYARPSFVVGLWCFGLAFGIGYDAANPHRWCGSTARSVSLASFGPCDTIIVPSSGNVDRATADCESRISRAPPARLGRSNRGYET